MSKCTRISFFILWAFFNIVGAIALCWNVKWHWLTTREIIGAAFIMFILIILHIGVMESLTVSVFTLIFCGDGPREKLGNTSNLTLLLNYNVLALDPGDVDEGMEKMFQSYMDNLTQNVSAVYLSATKDQELVNYEKLVRDKYRAKIRGILQEEVLAFIDRNYSKVNYFRQINMWRNLEDRHSLDYLKSNYDEICEKLSLNFMCIHRVSRVLRKCGQYQDLMLLSEGRFMAFTYTDPEYYGKFARPYGEPMFHDSDDVRNIHGRNFDYTFVLDCDSRIPPGVAHTILGVAAARPDKGIIQSAIKLEAGIWDTIFMNLEDLRQRLGEPTTNALARVFDQCGFYGKALIKNKIYIEKVIGTPDKLVEAVPVDVLSHDTYEAAILKPHFTTSAAIAERPTYNYLAWNSRQRRWNLGDMIVAMYMHPKLVGAPIRALQKCFQRKRYFRPRLRTPLKMDTVTAYIADSSFRSMFTKPLWLVLVLLHGFLPVPTYYHWLPVVIVLLIICVISKLSLFMRCHKGILYIIPELLSSICQYTPEIITGFIRFFRVMIALIRGKNDWIPQRRVEEEFDTVNPFKMFVYSYRHLWGYALLALLLMIMLILFDIIWGIYPLNSALKMILIYFDLTVIFCLPLYCFITSLRICPCCRRQKHKDSISDVESSLSSSGSGRGLLPPDGHSLLRHYTSTKVIDINKPGKGTLKSKIPMSARVFFRQLKDYAGQIAENRASWFTQRQTKPSDSFEFRVRHPTNSISSASSFGISRFVPEQKYVDMPSDYFKVTTIGPRPEHEHVVHIEHEEGQLPVRQNVWRQWEAPLHDSWLDLSSRGNQRNEIRINVEPMRSDDITLIKQRKIYYDQYGSYDTIHPLNEFPDSGRVYTSRKLMTNHLPNNPNSRIFADINTIEKRFPVDHIYTEINEISRNGQLYRRNAGQRNGQMSKSTNDLRAFHVDGPRAEVYTVIHNFGEEPLLRRNLKDIHVFNRDSSAPPVPPKSSALLEEWREMNTLSPPDENVEVTFHVTSNRGRGRLSRSLPVMNEISSMSDVTSRSGTRLERIAEDIYAEVRGRNDRDSATIKRWHSYNGYDGDGRYRVSSRGNIGGAVIISKSHSLNNVSGTTATVVNETTNAVQSGGLQGTIVAYDPNMPDDYFTQSTGALNDGKKWYHSEKVYQTESLPAHSDYAITLQPTPGSAQQSVSGHGKHQKNVVSGLDVNRWLHMDGPPPPTPLDKRPIAHKITRTRHNISGRMKMEKQHVLTATPLIIESQSTAFNVPDADADIYSNRQNLMDEEPQPSTSKADQSADETIDLYATMDDVLETSVKEESEMKLSDAVSFKEKKNTSEGDSASLSETTQKN